VPPRGPRIAGAAVRRVQHVNGAGTDWRNEDQWTGRRCRLPGAGGHRPPDPHLRAGCGYCRADQRPDR
jgi:hypothetical protein